jgi:hypothetical protein
VVLIRANTYLVLKTSAWWSKLNPSLLNTLLTQNGVIPYCGVTNISKMDDVPVGSTPHKVKAQGVQFPESLFIFGVPK